MRLLSLLIILCLFTDLSAQSRKRRTEQWIGIQNLFYQNASSLETRRPPSWTSNYPNAKLYQEETDKQLAFGFFWRKIKDNDLYRQIDFFAFDQRKDETFRYLEDSLTGDFIIPVSGRENKAVNISAAYQMGKLFPVNNWLQGDVGARLRAQYQSSDTEPRSSANFPTTLDRFGGGLDVRAGIVIKVHERLRIGYYLTPLRTDLFREKVVVGNPILTLAQRTTTGFKFESGFFESALDWRNLSINYVFTTRKRRRRRR